MTPQAMGEERLRQKIAELRLIAQTKRPVKQWYRDHTHGYIRCCMDFAGRDSSLGKEALDLLDALGRDEWHPVAQNRTQAVDELEVAAQ